MWTYAGRSGLFIIRDSSRQQSSWSTILLLILLLPVLSAHYNSWDLDSIVNEGIEALEASGLPQDWWSSKPHQSPHKFVDDKLDLVREPLPFDPEAYMTAVS